MNIYWKIICLVLLLVASFVSGWRVEYWHYTAERESEAAAAIKQQNKNMSTLIEDHNKEVARIDGLNAQTTAEQVHTQLLIQAQNDEIQKVERKLNSLKVGSCTLNSNADSLLNDAYKAAFPTTPPHAGKTKGG